MEGTHQLAGLGRAEVQLPKAEHLYQAGDEILARLTGEGHHGHGVQLIAQVMAQQQDAQHQRGRLARTGPGDHAGGRRIAEDHLPLRGARLGVGRQTLGNVAFEAFLELGGQWQAPVVEQTVVLPGHAVAIGTRVTDHQHLAPGFVAVHPPFFITLAHAIGMAGALAAGVALEPGVAVLGLQPAQAAAEHTRRQASDPG
ncbi:hypothetical protein D3C77_444030 [compost metagenome]